MSARLMITSSVIPTVTSPSGKTLTPIAVSGETNRYYANTIEYGNHTVVQTTGGTEATITVNVRECKIYDVADKTTFAGVQQILNAHMETDLLSVGDEMAEITLTGNEPMVWTIGAINLEQQHQVIFVPKWCLSSTKQMNSSNINNGGWNSCTMRTWLNGDFYNSLPSSVKPFVKDRAFQTSQGNQSTSLQSATDKIWLPREYEVLGSTIKAVTTEHSTGGAEQFPIFATASNRIKTQGKNGSASRWWESSPPAASSVSFCCILVDGSAERSSASEAYGVLPCFHMTANV